MSRLKVLVDSCVVIDALENRSNFAEDAQELIVGQVNEEYDAYITASSVTDIHYLIQSHTGDRDEALEAIRKICSIFYIADTSGSDCRHALILEGRDYEDRVVIATAIRTKMDCILTRNIKDFKGSPIPVQLPGEFLTTQEHSQGKISKMRKISKKKSKEKH